MKKALSIILSFILLCSSPCIYAEEIFDEDLLGEEVVTDHFYDDLVTDEPVYDDTSADDVTATETETEIVENDTTITPEQPEVSEPVIRHEKEIGVLQALGLMEAEDYTAAITRGEFVASVAKLCGYTGGSQSASAYFSDVPWGHENEGAIAYAAGIKLVQGDGTNFRPDDGITLEQAGFILLRALGYDSFSPYVTIDMAKAKQEGIYEGVSLNGNQTLTFDTAAKVIYNAMNLEMILVRGTTSDGIGTATKLEKDGTTLLNYYLKLYMTEGVVTDDGYAAASGTSINSDINVKIDGAVYEKGNADVTDLLGHEVEAYYDKDNVLIYVCDISDERDVLLIPADNIISASMGTVQYETETGKLRSVSFSLTSNIIYNGKALKNGEFKDEYLKPHIGSLKLVRTNKKDYNLVVITSEYNCAVSKVSEHNDIFTVTDFDSTDNNVKIDINDIGRTVKITDASGNNVSYKEIAMYNVLSVAKSLDGELISIKVSASKAGGVVEGISYGESMKITVNGTPYKMAYGADTTYVAVGTYGDLYLDIYGNVAYFYSLAKYETRFGYIIKARALVEETPQFVVKMFDAVGKVFTFVAEKRIIVDGVTVKDSGFQTLAESFYLGDEFQPCVVRYELNLDGSLKSIDTCTRTSSETETSLREIPANSKTEYASSMFYGFTRYELAPRMFDGQIFINDKTIIFGIPRGTYDDEDFLKFSLKYFINNRYYDVEFYTDDPECDTAKVVTVKYSPKYDPGLINEKGWILLPGLHGSGMSTGVITDIGVVVDDNGEVVNQVQVTDITTGNVFDYPLRWEEQAAGLCKGMVVRFLIMANRFVDIEPVFDMNTRSAMTPRDLNPGSNIKTFYVKQNGRDLVDNSTTEAGTSNTYVAWQLTYLDVLSLKGDMLKGVAGDASASWPSEYYDRTSTYPLSQVFRYDSVTKQLTKASINDVCGYDDVGSECSKVLAYYKTASLKVLIILD